MLKKKFRTSHLVLIDNEYRTFYYSCINHRVNDLFKTGNVFDTLCTQPCVNS